MLASEHLIPDAERPKVYRNARVYLLIYAVVIILSDVKNICFGKRRESISVHRLDKRQSSFIAWISRRA